MNLRNKNLVTTLRIVFGVLMLFSGAAGLLAGGSTEGVPASLVPVMQSFWNSGILQMIKATEAIAGLMLIFNIFPALAIIFIAPIGIGIIVFNGFLAPNFVITGVIVCAFAAYFGHAYWDKYKSLFTK